MKLKLIAASESPGIKVKVTSPEVLPRFLYYWVQNLHNSGKMKPWLTGSAIPHLSVKDFENLPFYDRPIKDVAQVGTNLKEYDFVVQNKGDDAGRPTWKE